MLLVQIWPFYSTDVPDDWAPLKHKYDMMATTTSAMVAIDVMIMIDDDEKDDDDDDDDDVGKNIDDNYADVTLLWMFSRLQYLIFFF